MSGWRLFWALVGYVAYIVVLIFLYFYKPFEDLFTLVINAIGYDNSIFWVVLIAGIVGFCGYHWRAYQLYIVQRRSVDGMVLASLRGSAFIAILLCAGAAALIRANSLRLFAAERIHARRRVLAPALAPSSRW